MATAAGSTDGPTAAAGSSRRTAIVVPIVGAGIFWLLAGPIPAITAGVAAALAFWQPSWRRRLGWVPGLMVAGVAAFVVAKLLRYDLPAGIGWPNEFEVTNAWAWAAVAAASALAVVDSLKPRSRSTSAADATAAGASPPTP